MPTNEEVVLPAMQLFLKCMENPIGASEAEEAG